MRISDWSSDVCSSDLLGDGPHPASGAGDFGGVGIASHRVSVAYGDRTAVDGARRARCVLGAAERRRRRPRERPPRRSRRCAARKSVVSGKSVSVRVDLGGRRIIKKKTVTRSQYTTSYVAKTTTTGQQAL